MTEEWKPIPDYEGLYEVSSLGNYNINYGTWKERHYKKIAQYDLNGNLIATYKSLTDAEKEGFTLCQISKCCNNKQDTHKGYRWTFI